MTQQTNQQSNPVTQQEKRIVPEATKPKPRNLYQKLAAIYTEMEAIKKGGRNKEQGYAFIEQGAVVAEIRSMLGSHGVALTSEVQSHTVEPFTTAKGTQGDKATVVMRFTLINADDPSERIICENWPGLAMDYSDKAINKAMTAAMKTFLMKEFMVSEFDPDNDSPEAVIPAPQQQINKPAQQMRPAPNMPPNTVYLAQPVRKPTETIPEPEDDFEESYAPGKLALELADRMSKATTLDALKAILPVIKQAGIVKGHADYQYLLTAYQGYFQTIDAILQSEKAGN